MSLEFSLFPLLFNASPFIGNSNTSFVCPNIKNALQQVSFVVFHHWEKTWRRRRRKKTWWVSLIVKNWILWCELNLLHSAKHSLAQKAKKEMHNLAQIRQQTLYFQCGVAGVNGSALTLKLKVYFGHSLNLTHICHENAKNKPMELAVRRQF